MSTEIIVGPTGPQGPAGPIGPTGLSYFLTSASEGDYGVNVTDGKNAGSLRLTPAHPIYGFELDMDESDPDSMIKYTDDNEFYTPARMDFTNDTFDYGDWANAWFIKECKPCILNFDGTVYKYLDPNDYTKDIDGNSVDIDENCVGNVMVEIPKICVKVNQNNPRKPHFTFCEAQMVNDDYGGYYGAYGTASRLYLAAYEGYLDSNDVMRSLSGQEPTGNETASFFISACRANNTSDSIKWDMGAFSERNLITLLLMLIGRSTNAQSVFGYGHEYSSETGTMNTKGLFWGSNADDVGVKVFGIEHFWGGEEKWTQGLIVDSGVLYFSTARGTYHTSADANIITNPYQYSIQAQSSSTAGYITQVHIQNELLVPFKIDGSGSSSTFFCDKTRIPSLGKGYAIYAGGSGDLMGPFYCRLDLRMDQVSSMCGCTISYK